MEQQIKLIENSGGRRNTVYFLDCAAIERLEKGNKVDNKPPVIKNRPLHTRSGNPKLNGRNKYEEIKWPDDGDNAPPANVKPIGGQQQLVHAEIIGVQYRKQNKISEKEKLIPHGTQTLIEAKEQKCMISGVTIDSIESIDSARSSTACDISSSVFSNSKSSSCPTSEIDCATGDDVSAAIATDTAERVKYGTGCQSLYFKDAACSANFTSSEGTEEEDEDEENEDGDEEGTEEVEGNMKVNMNVEECFPDDAARAVEMKSISGSSPDGRCDKVVENILNTVDVRGFETIEKRPVVVHQENGVSCGNDVNDRKYVTFICDNSELPSPTILPNKPTNNITGMVTENPKLPTTNMMQQNKPSLGEAKATIEQRGKPTMSVPPLKSGKSAIEEISHPKLVPKDKSIIPAVDTKNASNAKLSSFTFTKQRMDASVQAILDSDSSSEDKLEASQISDLLSSLESSSGSKFDLAVVSGAGEIKLTCFSHDETKSHGIQTALNKSSEIVDNNQVCSPRAQQKNSTNTTKVFPCLQSLNSSKLTTCKHSFVKPRRDNNKSAKNVALENRGWSDGTISSSGKGHEHFHSKLVKSLSKCQTLRNKLSLNNERQVNPPKKVNTLTVNRPLMNTSYTIQEENQTETDSSAENETIEKQNGPRVKVKEGIAKDDAMKRKGAKSPINPETSRELSTIRFYSSNASPFSVKIASPSWNRTLLAGQQSRNTSLSPTRKNASKRYRHTPVLLTPRIKEKLLARNNHIIPFLDKPVALRTVSCTVPKRNQSFIERRDFVKQFSSSIREMNKTKKRQPQPDSWHNLPCKKPVSNQTDVKPCNYSPISYCPTFIEGNNNIYVRDNAGDEARISMASSSRIIPMSKKHT